MPHNSSNGFWLSYTSNKIKKSTWKKIEWKRPKVAVHVSLLCIVTSIPLCPRKYTKKPTTHFLTSKLTPTWARWMTQRLHLGPMDRQFHMVIATCSLGGLLPPGSSKSPSLCLFLGGPSRNKKACVHRQPHKTLWQTFTVFFAQIIFWRLLI